MHVKGTAYLARVSYLEKRLGADTVKRFLADHAAKVPALEGPIVPTTRIPAEAFLDLNDEIVRRFFEGDEHSYWAMGLASAEWGLREGPYKHFIDSKSYEQFLATGPALWSAYYDDGTLRSWWNDADHRGEVEIVDVPIAHVYFEYAVMAYVERALELTGATLEETRCVAGFSKGDDRVHYQFLVAR